MVNIRDVKIKKNAERGPLDLNFTNFSSQHFFSNPTELAVRTVKSKRFRSYCSSFFL